MTVKGCRRRCRRISRLIFGIRRASDGNPCTENVQGYSSRSSQKAGWAADCTSPWKVAFGKGRMPGRTCFLVLFVLLHKKDSTKLSLFICGQIILFLRYMVYARPADAAGCLCHSVHCLILIQHFCMILLFDLDICQQLAKAGF